MHEWGYEFELVLAPVSEELCPDLTPEQAVQDLAGRKAMSGCEIRGDQGSDYDIILGADTIVVLDDMILGKPVDKEDAENMLSLLSGRTHHVMTGIALAKQQGQQVDIETDVEATAVTFRELSRREIRDYVATGEPMDKAAAYAIQGGAAGFAVCVQGSVTNVIGLPMELLAQKLKNRGIVPKYREPN